MSDLVVIVYPTEARAEEMRQKLIGLQKEYLIEIGDAAIAVMHEGGKVKLNQLLNTTAMGAVSGSFWGLLIGAIFLMPIFGAALGAASGALGGALTDYGVDIPKFAGITVAEDVSVKVDLQGKVTEVAAAATGPQTSAKTGPKTGAKTGAKK